MYSGLQIKKEFNYSLISLLSKLKHRVERVQL